MNTKSHIVTLRLTTDIYDVVQKIAKTDDIPQSFVIRRALKKGLGIQETTSITPPTNSPIDAKADEIVEGWE